MNLFYDNTNLLVSNDYNPNDPTWLQVLDQLTPDQQAMAIEMPVRKALVWEDIWRQKAQFI